MVVCSFMICISCAVSLPGLQQDLVGNPDLSHVVHRRGVQDRLDRPLRADPSVGPPPPSSGSSAAGARRCPRRGTPRRATARRSPPGKGCAGASERARAAGCAWRPPPPGPSGSGGTGRCTAFTFSSEAMRAFSSTCSHGLPRKSSAPASSARTFVSMSCRAGHHDDGDDPGRLALLQPANGLDAVHARHGGIHQDEVGRLRRRPSPAHPRRPRRSRRGSRGSRQSRCISLADLLVVVDDEDDRRAARAPAHPPPPFSPRPESTVAWCHNRMRRATEAGRRLRRGAATACP